MTDEQQINLAAGMAAFMAIVIGLMSEDISTAVVTFLGVFALGLFLMSLEERG